MKLKITTIAIEHLKPYEHNAKVHTPDQIRKIANSIKRFGFNDPIAIDRDNVIIEGNGRLEAAKQLGLKEVPTIYLNELSEAQKRAYIIAHNKLTTETGYNDNLMAEVEELLNSFTGEELIDIGIDPLEFRELDEFIGSDVISEIDSIIEQPEPANLEDNSEPEQAQEYTDQNCNYPIVPDFFEHHEAFIIPVHNKIDESFIRDLFNLNENQISSTGDGKIRKANVIDIEQVRKCLVK